MDDLKFFAGTYILQALKFFSWQKVKLKKIYYILYKCKTFINDKKRLLAISYIAISFKHIATPNTERAL